MIMLHRLANPTRLNSTLIYDEIEIDDNRLNNCPFYDSCLVYAGMKKWCSFSCKNCRIFIEEKERQVIAKLLLNI